MKMMLPRENEYKYFSINIQIFKIDFYRLEVQPWDKDQTVKITLTKSFNRLI